MIKIKRTTAVGNAIDKEETEDVSGFTMIVFA